MMLERLLKKMFGEKYKCGYIDGYINGYVDGYEQGKKDERTETVYKKYTMNEIREACGFSRVEKEEVK